MIEKDINNWINFKKLSKTELKLMITNIILSVIFIIATIINGAFLYSNWFIYIYIIIAVTVGIWALVNSIIWIVNKVKQFGVYNEFSNETKEKQNNLFIFLILSIFFGFIFGIVIYCTLPKEIPNTIDSNLENSNSSTSTPVKPSVSTQTNEIYYKELTSLKDLLDKEIINKEEFDKRKKEIMDSLK